MQDTTMKVCRYNDTCSHRTPTCEETEMIQAKPIIQDKFWIVEQNGSKFATLRKNEDDRFVLSNESGIKIYDNKESLTDQFGKDFFTVKIVKEADNAEPNEVHGYSTSATPHNAMFDVKENYRCLLKAEIVKVYIVLVTMLSSLKKGGLSLTALN